MTGGDGGDDWRMNRRVLAGAAAVAIAAAALVALVVVGTHGDEPGSTAGTTPTASAPATVTAPGASPPPVPAWGDFAGAPPALAAAAGGSAVVSEAGPGDTVTVRRADGTPLAVATFAGGVPIEARYFDRRGALRVVVAGLRTRVAGLAPGGARVRCDSPASRLADFRWTRFPVVWRLGTAPVAPGVTRAAALAAIRRARGTWNANRSHCRTLPDRSRARFAFAGPSRRTLGLDGVSVVEFGPVARLGGVCAGTVACTVTWVSAGRAVESDTRIDRLHPGGFSAGTPRRSALDLQSVMVHESGHTLGFDHVSARSVVMFPVIVRGTVGGRRLGRGDALVNNRRY